MKFEEIKVWQKAELMTLSVYSQLKDVRDYGYRDQIQRTAVSVMNNIAEGYERKSKKNISFISWKSQTVLVRR